MVASLPATLVATRDDWFVLPLEASPEGTGAGFRIPVPAGAAVPAWYGQGHKVVVAEVAVLGSGTLDAFHVEAGQKGKVLAEWTAFANGGPWSATVNEKASTGAIQPDYIYIEATEGTELFLLVGAIGSGDATVALRYAARDPIDSKNGTFTPPARDSAGFLDGAQGRQGLRVSPVGQATGFHVDFLYDYHSLVIPSSTRFTHGDMEVTEALPDTTVRPVTVLDAYADKPAGEGYASQAAWTWNGLHAGTTTATLVTPDGGSTQFDGMVTPDAFVTSNIALARGEGTGAASIDFSLHDAGVPGLFPQLILVSQVHFDAKASTLVGETIKPDSLSYEPMQLQIAQGSAYARVGSQTYTIPWPEAGDWPSSLH